MTVKRGTDLYEFLAKPSMALGVAIAERGAHLLVHFTHLLLAEGRLFHFTLHTLPPILSKAAKAQNVKKKNP